jgi:CheY-like chemotaxis protein
MNQNILLVENDSEVVDSLFKAFEAYGHTVTAARSGQEALRKLAAGLRPTVLLVDHALNSAVGGVDLVEICETHADLREISAVITTGFLRTQIGPAVGRWQYVRKPNRLEEIESLLVLHQLLFFPPGETSLRASPPVEVPGERDARS